MSTLAQTLAQTLAAFAASPRIPGEVRTAMAARVLDTLGVALGALRLDTSRAAIAHVREQGGIEQATAIGITGRFPAPNAAFIGGVLAHSLDYDDTHLPSILHPSASVIPAVLSAAQITNAPGAQVIDAIAVGLEICCRLGMAGYDPATRNSTFFEHGQHATSICGTVAAAAAAAVVLGANETKIVDAIGLAVSMGAGVIEANRTGGTVKRLHCGLAAQNGVNAAMLALRGFTGPPTALEGRFGFFQAHLHGAFDAEAVTNELGERWETARIFTKPYPCNHFTHAGIDAALGLRARGVTPDQIDTMTLGVAAATVRTIGEPIDRKRAPETGYQAQFSGPYTVAAALLGGGGLGLGLEDFTDELANDPARRALMARIDVVEDPTCNDIYPYEFPAVLTARFHDSNVMTQHILTTRGGPSRPLSADEQRRKFNDTAGEVLAPDVLDRIAERAAGLTGLPSVNDLLDPTTTAKEA